MKQPTLLIRADANVAMGTGHVMRCLALAQAYQDAGGRAAFAIGEAPLDLRKRLAAEGFLVLRTAGSPGSLTDADRTAALASKLGARWVVVDGDRFEVKFLERVRSSRAAVLLVDDFAARKTFPVDIVVNPNIGASAQDYDNKVRRDALLLGPSYVFLRREFASMRTPRVFPEIGCRILVTLGGSDPENLAPKIVKPLARIPGYEVTLVTGPGYRHANDLSEVKGKVRVVHNPSNMPKLMAKTDIAVIAGGGTLWELLYLGRAVLSYARNSVQQRIVEELARRHAVRNMGSTRQFDPMVLLMSVAEVVKARRLRQEMARIGRLMLDGRGVMRVLRAMHDWEVRA